MGARQSSSSAEQGDTIVVKARAAHTHHWGVVTFTKRTKEAKMPAADAASSPNTPPTKKELDDAKKRVVSLHKALLNKSLVCCPDMDVEDMLSTMTLVGRPSSLV